MSDKNNLQNQEQEIKTKKESKKGTRTEKRKKKLEPMQIFSAIIAGLLCLMMLLSVCSTLIFYLKG